MPDQFPDLFDRLKAAGLRVRVARENCSSCQRPRFRVEYSLPGELVPLGAAAGHDLHEIAGALTAALKDKR